MSGFAFRTVGEQALEPRSLPCTQGSFREREMPELRGDTKIGQRAFERGVKLLEAER